MAERDARVEILPGQRDGCGIAAKNLKIHKMKKEIQDEPAFAGATAGHAGCTG